MTRFLWLIGALTLLGGYVPVSAQGPDSEDYFQLCEEYARESGVLESQVDQYIRECVYNYTGEIGIEESMESNMEEAEDASLEGFEETGTEDYSEGYTEENFPSEEFSAPEDLPRSDQSIY